MNASSLSMNAMTGYRFHCEFTLWDGAKQVFLWILLSVVTLGVGVFISGYYINKAVHNKTFLVSADGAKVAQLVCEMPLSKMIGHALLWLLISVVTFGVGAVLYVYSVERLLLNHTHIRTLEEARRATA